MTSKVALEDFACIAIPGAPQASPDGKRVAFTVRTTDLAKNIYRTRIWLAAPGTEPRPLTSADCSSYTPRWSPNGAHIAFLSDRTKPLSQIWLLPMAGGEASALTTLQQEGSISSICWSPTGKHIAFLFHAVPDEWRTEAKQDREKRGASSPVRTHARLPYRMDGDGYIDGTYTQVALLETATGKCSFLTEGPYSCSDLLWTPENTLLFLSDRRPDSDLLPYHTGIYEVDIQGGPLREIPSPPGSKSSLAISPDGARLAWAGSLDDRDAWGTRNSRALCMPRSGGEAADLTGRTDLCLGYSTLSDCRDAGQNPPLQWLPNGQIMAAFSVQGTVRLMRFADDGQMQLFSHEQGDAADFHVSANGESCAFLWGDAVRPAELYLAEITGGAPTALTRLNEQYLAQTSLQQPEPVQFPGEPPLHGWLLHPPQRGSEPLPLLIYVHGGPHAQYGDVFFHEMQLLAAEGFRVLYTNPRGSKGYGEAHTRAILDKWGTVDFEDIQRAADYAAARPDVDAQRMAILGGSYGGYMTAWAIGHTNRFKCAIADRLVANMVSMSGTTDFPWKHGYVFSGNSWSDTEALWRQSPLASAGNVQTPLLLIHSDGDMRCPAGQAEEYFAALRLQGKPVEYVRYPAESSHGMSRNGPPDLRIDRLKRNIEWLHRHLTP